MELSKNEIFSITSDTHKFYSWEQLIIFFEQAFELYMKFTLFLKENDYKLGFTSKKSPFFQHNPLNWEIGHPIFFMEKHFLRYVYDKDTYPRTNTFINDIYDSFNISLEERFNLQKVPYEVTEKYYIENHTKIIDFINMKQTDISNSEYYCLMFVLLHLHMHIESFIFTNQLVYKINPFKNEFNTSIIPDLYKESIINEIEMIDIRVKSYSFKGFYQGNRTNSIYYENNKFHFDNESPSFFKKLNDFKISKTLITNYMYLQFVLDKGYNNDNYWSSQGKYWKNKSYVLKPIYWTLDNDIWYVNYFGTLIKLEDIHNYPVVNITWFEAEAYCSWAGGRLPTESEWEYLSTNCGTTLYPWGNDENLLRRCNINYEKRWVTSVNDNPEDVSLDNKDGVQQLIGNCWEWCSNIIYPYEGFKIDPLYREMSYPFFGFKKICRGGAWCVPDILITSSYRNAQMPDCNIQYIGFRLVKDL